ncbi:MAG: hypothetical protein EOO01_26645 [Chitinophagaceae bacterium]|nr:MAG: hypothetical protein EOO01_26645 [Chitinophagaceae bacterium]
MKDIVDRHYGRLFPAFFISRKLTANQSINFSYSRRINRPAFTDLAPFIFFFDPNTFVSGNSALQPAITDNIKVDYTFKKYLLSASYSYEDNYIAVFQSRIDPKTNKQVLFAENLHAVQSVSLLLSMPFTIRPWWSMQNNISGIWQNASLDNDHNLPRSNVKQANVNLRNIQSFQLPGDFSMELSGSYQSASIFGRYKVQGYGQLDVGVQKKFKNHNEKIRLAYTNIFSSNKWVWQTNTGSDNFSRTTLQFSKATVQITYSRNFGRNSVKAARDRTTGAAEERGRVQ